MKEENKRLKRASVGLTERVTSGCGLWCGGVICGCCNNYAPEEQYKSTENGIDNNGFDVEGVL